VSVCVTNELGGVCSSTATLTVLLNPKLLSASSQGNCHALFLNFNRLMTLEGTYTVVSSNNAFGAAFYSEDFSANDGGYTVTNLLPYDGPWVYAAASGSWTEAGQVTENGQQNTSYLNSPPITLAAGGPVQLSFAHRHSFEQGGGFWDAGQVRLSVNGGPFTTVPGSAFSQNGYTGTISANPNNTLQNQDGFAGNSAGYATTTITSVCTLGSFNAGDIIQVQFIAANDGNTAGEFQPGWELTSVQLSALVPNLTPLTVTGPTYGSSQQQLRLGVSPDLAEGNVYYVTVTGATSQGDNLLVDPNPSIIAVVHGVEYPPFQILYKRFNGAGGVSLNDLYAMAKYPNSPDVVSTRFLFEVPTDVADNYGATVAGYYKAPSTGLYRFWCSADDNAGTFLATDANPANVVQINVEPQWNGSRQFAVTDRRTADANGYPSQTQSAPISLTAGQVVYLEGRVKEGGGGDNYSCAVTIDNPVVPANGSLPIAAADFVPKRLSPSGFIFETLCDAFFTTPVADQTGYPSLTVTFTAKVDGTPIAAGNAAKGYNFQWSSNGVPIVGATSPSYTTVPLAVANNGDIYSVEVSNDFSSATDSATLTVQERPVVVSASTRNHPRNVYVQFNIPVVYSSATAVLTNSLDPVPLDLASVAYGSSHSEVILTTANDIPINSTCGLAVSGVVAENGGGTQVIDPTYVLFGQGPSGGCTDFATLPANAVLNGSAVLGGDNSVHITEAVNGQQGSIVFSWTQPIQDFKANYKLLMGDASAGFADGSSFSFAPDVAGSFGEGGSGSGLTVTFQTYAPNYRGFRLLWGGQEKARLSFDFAQFATPATYQDVVIQMTAGYVTVTYAGITIWNNFQIQGYAPLVGNAKFGIGGRTGGENQKTYVSDLCFNNFTLGNIGATVSQTTSTPAECATVSFSSTVTGSPPHYYQWLRNGTPIAGAVGPTYTTPPISCPADQGAVYALAVTNLFSAAAASATALTVACDDAPPTLVSAGSITGSAIGAQFTEAVDPATATNPGNYSVNGGAFGDNIAGVALMPAYSPAAVIITLSNALSAAFTVTASNVVEVCPARNSIITTAAGTIVNATLTTTNLGPGAPAGLSASFSADEVVITGGGNDIWDVSDQCHFAYVERCGDFDTTVQVTRLDPRSRWSKAGLDARMSVTANSAHIMSVFTPFGPTTPNNQGNPGADGIDAGLRLTTGGNTDWWGRLGAGTFGGKGAPTLSAGINWMRLQRTGDRFRGYHSSDGINWTNHADTLSALCGQVPTNMFVGMVYSSHNNGAAGAGVFESFSITPPGVCEPKTSCGPVAISYDGAGNVVLTWADSCCTLQGATALSSDPAQTVWTPIGGTSPLTLPAGSPLQFFRTSSP
jgi:hypothetical protein